MISLIESWPSTSGPTRHPPARWWPPPLGPPPQPKGPRLAAATAPIDHASPPTPPVRSRHRFRTTSNSLASAGDSDAAGRAAISRRAGYRSATSRFPFRRNAPRSRPRDLGPRGGIALAQLPRGDERPMSGRYGFFVVVVAALGGASTGARQSGAKPERLGPRDGRRRRRLVGLRRSVRSKGRSLTYSVDISDTEWAAMNAEFHNLAALESGADFAVYHPIVFHLGERDSDRRRHQAARRTRPGTRRSRSTASAPRCSSTSRSTSSTRAAPSTA